MGKTHHCRGGFDAQEPALVLTGYRVWLPAALRLGAIWKARDGGTLCGGAMFEVSVEYTFAAGHALRGYKGKCENVHGHNYKVQLVVGGQQLDQTGLLMDFVEVRRTIKALVERLDHKFLNDVAPFDKLNPSAENIAKYFCDEMEPEIRNRGLRVQGVTVWETDTTSATYRPS